MDAKQQALYYLGIKPRTCSQVREYLIKKGFDETEINEVVNELMQYRYIDDLNFCVQYFEYGFEKKRGIARIRRELREKGVSDEIIDMAYDELEECPDQFDTAMQIGLEVIGNVDTESIGYEERQKLKARVARRLASRGFSSEIVYKVINNLL